MQFQLPLPPNLAVAAAEVVAHFERIPSRSCIVRPTLTDAAGSVTTPLADSYIYGRGEGSEARARVHVVVRLSAAVMAQRRPEQNLVVMTVLELSGEAIDEQGFLELVSHEVHALRSAP